MVQLLAVEANRRLHIAALSYQFAFSSPVLCCCLICPTVGSLKAVFNRNAEGACPAVRQRGRLPCYAAGSQQLQQHVKLSRQPSVNSHGASQSHWSSQRHLQRSTGGGGGGQCSRCRLCTSSRRHNAPREALRGPNEARQRPMARRLRCGCAC